jgi:mono/diheme cytochrome c family protein
MRRLWLAPFAALLMVPTLTLADAADVATGEQLYTARCALCHTGFAPGTIMLGRRLGQERALLAERSDLAADYVRYVVRHGLLGMPPFTRVDLTEAELAQVSAYLTRPRAPAAPAAAP